MPIELTPDDTEIILREADRAARRLHRKLALPLADLDDLRQELLVDLCQRLPGFDPGRGSMGAFAGLVIRNQCSRLAVRHHRQRQARGGVALSLDAPVAGGLEPLGWFVAESDGLTAWLGGNRCARVDAETRHDVAKVLGALAGDLRALCTALAAKRPEDLARRDGPSRSTLYRRLARLRLEFAMRGIDGRPAAA